MRIFDRCRVKISKTRWLSVYALVMVVFLAQTVMVQARRLDSSQRFVPNSHFQSSYVSLFDAPVAGDDSGQGFTTDENKSLDMANLLSNDSDSDGDPLYVYGVDTANMLGILTRRDNELDLSFDEDGILTTDISSSDDASDLVVLPDGKIILAGNVDGGADRRSDFAVLRYNPDGSLDPSFSFDGIATTDFGWTDIAEAVAYQADNKIIVAGAVFENSLGIARYNSDGSPDLSFGDAGKVKTTGVNVQDRGFMGVALQEDGKIVVAGTSYDLDLGYTILVARFTPDGNLDLSFDEDGIVTAEIGIFTLGLDLLIQPDEMILVSGSGSDPETGKGRFALARFLPDGSLDASFSEDGLVLTVINPAYNSAGAVALALQPDNKIVVTGNADDHLALARYNPDGSLDDAFDGDGVVVSDSLRNKEVALQPDGRILVVGTYGSDIAAHRFNPDGSLDATFGDDGILRVDTGDNDRGAAVAVESHGTILMAGDNGGDFVLARLIVDGIFSYDPDGQFNYLKSGEQASDTFTYVVSDGILTDTATVTITIVGRFENFYLPFVYIPPRAIYGWVTENGAPASGIPLELRFYDGTNWSTVSNTLSTYDGRFLFYTVATLLPGQAYAVVYSNSDDPNRLGFWATRILTTYTINTAVNIGSFDIAGLDLISPSPGEVVSLPYAFRWMSRTASPSDSYEFNLFDPTDEDPYFYTDPPLGYVGSYTLDALPPGFEPGTQYAWGMYVYSPDGGYGRSYWARYVSFVDIGLNYFDAIQPMQLKPLLDLEYQLER